MTHTINTKAGSVQITNAKMMHSRSFGSGKFVIVIDILFKGKSDKINIHSANNILFDTLEDIENDKEYFEYLMLNQGYNIEITIEEYINSL